MMKHEPVAVTLLLPVFLIIAMVVVKCDDCRALQGHCCDILCPPGEEPVPCSDDDPRSTRCKPCDEQTFSDGPSRLGEHCSLKQTCSGEYMRIRSPGSPVMDAECECEDGYRYSNYVGKCYSVRPHLPATINLLTGGSATPKPKLDRTSHALRSDDLETPVQSPKDNAYSSSSTPDISILLDISIRAVILNTVLIWIQKM